MIVFVSGHIFLSRYDAKAVEALSDRIGRSVERFKTPVQSSKLLLVLASTFVLGFGPRRDPWSCSFQTLRVLKWGLLLFEGWRGLTTAGHSASTGESLFWRSLSVTPIHILFILRHLPLKTQVPVKVMLKTGGQSVLVSITHLGLTTRFFFLSDSCWFVDVGRPLWREDWSFTMYNIFTFYMLLHQCIYAMYTRLPLKTEFFLNNI
jgi:hypothetical protein